MELWCGEDDVFLTPLVDQLLPKEASATEFLGLSGKAAYSYCA